MISPEVLRRFPLFAGQNAYMLDEIAMISDEISVSAGDWLFHENEDAKKFYLILEGEIALTLYIYYKGSAKHLKTTSALTKGQFFGWSALVPPHHYKLGALAETNSKLLVIDGKALRQLFDDNPEFGYPFMKNIAEEISDRLEYKIIQVLSLVLEPNEKNLEAEKQKSPN
jgi:CRP/FNR family cyclic AMP-dependent transcriptional regulator